MKHHGKVSMAFLSKYLGKLVDAGFLLRKDGEYEITDVGMMFVRDRETIKLLLETLEDTVGEERLSRGCHSPYRLK